MNKEKYNYNHIILSYFLIGTVSLQLFRYDPCGCQFELPDLSSLWLSTLQAAASTANPGHDKSRAPPPPPQSQSPLKKRLQRLLEGARESWTYAIFWESSYDNFSGASLLRWGDGYYQGEEDEAKVKAPKTTSSSSAEQAHRKKVLLELNSWISGPSVSADDVDEEVSDAGWFFLLSMTQSFANDTTLPGQAFFNSTPVWVTGPDRLSELGCERARQGRLYGLRTLVCIPSANGVVELASTEVIFQNPDLMNKVLDLFNVNSVDPTLVPPRQRKDKRSCERAGTGMQNSENNNLSEQSRGKEKISDLKCSWPLLSESSNGGSDSTFSHSDDYSGPS